MRKYQKQFLVGLMLTLGFYIVYMIVADGQAYVNGTNGLLPTLAAFNWRWLPLLILSQFGVIFCRFMEWQFYMGIVGARQKMSWQDSAIIFIACFIMVVSPGKAAELLKTVFVKAKTGVSIAKTAPAVIAERVIDGLVVIILMMLALLLAGENLNLGSYEGVDYHALSRGIVFFSAAMLLLGMIVIQIQPLAYFCLNWIARIPLIKRFHHGLLIFYESSREIFYWRNVLVAFIPGTGVFLFSTLCFVMILSGFGLMITPTVILQVLFIIGITSAVAALSFAPNGAGVTEASSLILLLVMIAPTNPAMTPTVAAAAALLQGFFHKWFRVLVGLAVALIFRQRLFADDFEKALVDTDNTEAEHVAKTRMA